MGAQPRRSPHLLACVGFELSRLSTEWGLVRLAEHAAGLDVAGFAAQNEAACIDSGRATDSDTAADKLVGLIYAEYVASRPDLSAHGAPLPGDDESSGIGVALWRALSETEGATWKILEGAVDHPRYLELTVQACAHALQSTPTVEKAVQIKAKLTELLASVTEGAKFRPLSDFLEEAPAEDSQPAEEEEAPGAAALRMENKAASSVCRQLRVV